MTPNCQGPYPTLPAVHKCTLHTVVWTSARYLRACSGLSPGSINHATTDLPTASLGMQMSGEFASQVDSVQLSIKQCSRPSFHRDFRKCLGSGNRHQRGGSIRPGTQRGRQMFMYVCMYTYIYIYMFAYYGCMYMCIDVYAYIHVCACVCVCGCGVCIGGVCVCV